MSKSHEHALVLLDKADEDLFTIEKLSADPRSPQAVVGFHAQQAVEECLKAVLTNRAISYPWTHDLGLLLDLLGDSGISLPPDAAELPNLTLFAAELRYGRLPNEDGAAEVWAPDLVLAWAVQTRRWAGMLVGG